MPAAIPATERPSWIRQKVIGMSYAARSAHLGSSLSCVEILDAVYTIANITPDNATAPHRDRVVMSKGHAAMAAYATLAAHDLMDPAYLENYLAADTPLWGHVTQTQAVPAIDASTGSLGHGLGVASGYALAHRLRELPHRSFCILSDGECDEGSTWEAASFAGHHRLESLTAVIDYNKIQSLDFCDKVLTKEPFEDRWHAFGWDVTTIPGHDVSALTAAIEAPRQGRPRAVIADTIKGKGIARIENTVASHYHPAKEEDAKQEDGA